MVSASRGRSAWFSWLLVWLCSQSAAADSCSVPTTAYPTIGAAARDVACTTVQLAAGNYPENLLLSRDVAIEGASASTTTVAGTVEAAGAATDVLLARLSLDGTASGVAGCWPSLLQATAGARLAADDDVEVTNSGVAAGPCRVFADGFEAAGTLAWSAATP